MWWKQESNVTGFVALSNVSSQPAHASVLVSDGQMNALAQHNVTVSPHGTKLVNLQELQSAAASVGGMLITYDGAEDGLVINGGLQDQATGYSASLPFRAPPSASAEPSSASYAELGLMMGAADPMMLFPAGTTFTPYSILRNVSEEPIRVAPTLYWMEGAAVHSASLAPLTLLPHQTQSLSVVSLASAAGLKNFNGTVNLILDTQGKTGGILLSAGSVDQKNTYVFQVRPHGIGESAAQSLSYWSTRNGDDTIWCSRCFFRRPLSIPDSPRTQGDPPIQCVGDHPQPDSRCGRQRRAGNGARRQRGNLRPAS
jgi:hypothetical protein